MMRSSCCEGVSISPASSQWFLGPTATADPGTAGWSLLKHTHKPHHFGLKFCKVILQCGIVKTCTIFLALAIVLFDVAGTWCTDTVILEINAVFYKSEHCETFIVKIRVLIYECYCWYISVVLICII